jgi:hypothetical protein
VQEHRPCRDHPPSLHPPLNFFSQFPLPTPQLDYHRKRLSLIFLIFGPCAFDSPCTAAAGCACLLDTDAQGGGGGGGGSSGGGGVNEKGMDDDAFRSQACPSLCELRRQKRAWSRDLRPIDENSTKMTRWEHGIAGTAKRPRDKLAPKPDDGIGIPSGGVNLLLSELETCTHARRKPYLRHCLLQPPRSSVTDGGACLSSARAR